MVQFTAVLCGIVQCSAILADLGSVVNFSNPLFPNNMSSLCSKSVDRAKHTALLVSVLEGNFEQPKVVVGFNDNDLVTQNKSHLNSGPAQINRQIV